MHSNDQKGQLRTLSMLVSALLTLMTVMVSCSGQKQDSTEEPSEYAKPRGEFARIAPESIYILKSSSISFDSGISEFWVPTEADVAKSLVIIEKAFLDKTFMKSRSNDKKSIVSNIEKYQLQIVGVVRNGQKHVYINALLPYQEEKSRDLDKEIIVVFDGGWYFWQAELDVRSKQLVAFDINGYA